MRINEIFLSLQGEGFFTGTPAVFVRMAGCNLRCPFCDTSHGSYREMTEQEVAAAVEGYGVRHVVVTGGEPALQLTTTLIEALHRAGCFVAIETNGTRPLPEGLDWITCSPKTGLAPGATLRLTACDELKMVYTGTDPVAPPTLQARHRFLQPCDTGDADENARLLRGAVDYCLTHPQWRLSLQTHKLIGIR